MRNSIRIILMAGMMVATAFLTGCMHGETFDEWKAQLFDNDPLVLQVVPPNDTEVDEKGRVFAQAALETIEQRKNFTCDVKLVPSQRLIGFIANSRDRQLFAKTVSTRIFSGFNALSDFNFVGNEADALDTAPTAVSTANDTYSLVFDIVNLNVNKRVDQKYNMITQKTEPFIVFDGTTEVALTLLDPEGKQKLYMLVKPSVAQCETPEAASDALAAAAAQMLVADYGRQVAPPAYVSEMRGNGLFAKISIGSAYGVQLGDVIRFFEQETVANAVTGSMENRQTQLATGVVKQLGSDYAWVKIDWFHYRRVHIGTLVGL